MSTTYEEILNLFRESDRKFQEMREEIKRSALETEQVLQEARQETEQVRQEARQETERVLQEARQETERVLQEARQKTEEARRETEEVRRETERTFAETNRIVAETSRIVAETSRKVAEVSKNLGDIGNRLGQFVEEMVKPAVVRLFRERDVDVHSVIHRYEGGDEGKKFEVDLLVINGGDAIAVECKSRPSEGDVLRHVQRLKRVRQTGEVLQGKRLMGAIAGMAVSDAVKEFARQQGFYVLVQNGDNISIDNPKDFSPTYW